MRRPRKLRQAQPLSPPALAEACAGPLGSWAHADVLALPRFPDRKSFPTAKDLINRFLSQDGLTLRDLKIALFWLGFGLLEAPTPERPTMSLVPLCKDLDLYQDSAVELGYDPSASVHGRPVFLQADSAQCQVGLAVDIVGTGPSSSSSGSHSSSSSSGLHATAASSAGSPPQAGGDQVRQVRQVRAFPPGEVSLCLTDDEEDEGCAKKEDQSSLSGKVFCQAGARGENEDDSSDGYGTHRPQSGGGASSRAGDVQGVQVAGSQEEASRLLMYKVKLLHAGGWSSSSGSEGNRTPPAPPASSSTAVAAEAQGGGLDADHVAQFTVSFISDLELHEELQDTSCLCTFCLDEMEIGEELCRLPCMHTFHRSCIYAWLERDRRCMLCRLDVTKPCG